MLLQSDPLDLGGKIRVLPAWPKDWNVDFKLHAMGNTTVRGIYENTLLATVITPDSRSKDVR